MMERWSEREMLELAARGLGKVDQRGVRGVTLVSMEEIAAMAAVLAAFGLKPVAPGEAAPDEMLVAPEGGS